MEKHVVISDLHGFIEPFRNVVNYYGNGVIYDINGDVLNRGENVPEVLSLANEIDANLNRANHEWVFLGALTDIDGERRDAWQRAWLGDSRDDRHRMERNMLRAYGIEHLGNTRETAKAIKNRMQELGHLAILQKATMYVETDDMLVIHAGLDSTRQWQVQRREVDAAGAIAATNAFAYEPACLYSRDYARDRRLPRDLQKTLVTGHYHCPSISIDDRVVRNKKGEPTRVMLASHLDKGAPLFVYENWTGQVRAFEQD